MVTSCSPIHSGEREMQKVLKYSILYFNAHLTVAKTFTDNVWSTFKPQSHCKINWLVSNDFSILLHYRKMQWNVC